MSNIKGPTHFSPTAKPWGSNLLIRRFALSFGWKSPPAKKMIPMGVNKALDGKGRFLKPDYHYTTIFLASWNPIITTLRYFGPEPHYRYTTISWRYRFFISSVYVSVSSSLPFCFRSVSFSFRFRFRSRSVYVLFPFPFPFVSFPSSFLFPWLFPFSFRFHCVSVSVSFMRPCLFPFCFHCVSMRVRFHLLSPCV